jgi:hypothetical protein
MRGQHRQRIGAGGRIGHRRAAADRRRRIAGHVAHQQAHDLRRRAGPRQPASLDRREMLPHAVHLVDRGAALQQRPVDRLLLVEAHALGRQGEQRRGAAGDQAEDEIVLAQAAGERANPCRGTTAGFVGHRMGRLDDLDPGRALFAAPRTPAAVS